MDLYGQTSKSIPQKILIHLIEIILIWISFLITRNWFAVSIPILLFFFFAFYNAPKLDEYLQGKYGKEYDEYAAKTKMLIPYLF